ncbi:hypothetical protein KS4_15590 [Poriferisphaera corsica]|uniref:Uncharacterized protein n=1 Tax=Poriferisphaera corsica TaxID=2528020 RepID=A0A517YTG0_9BACT|nr:hypothetical protein [Poriferisphaera corsica]QDU33509.1 hypothetical protein KS4_15590 [Poriferisphaera corsica]
MSLKEKLEQNKPLSMIVMLCVIGLSLSSVCYYMLGGGGVVRDYEQAFFTVDDGVNYFAADAMNVTGFEHEGQIAYRAYIFRDGDGEPFVGYMERYTAAGRKAALKAMADSKAGKPTSLSLPLVDQEVKKPGDKSWTKRSNPRIGRVVRVVGVDGSSRKIEPVYPD